MTNLLSSHLLDEQYLPQLSIESGVAVGFRLSMEKPARRLVNVLPFFLLLAYDQNGRPHQIPEVVQTEVKEFAVCQQCYLLGNPDRIPPYTPLMFNYYIDRDGRWKLWGKNSVNLGHIRKRKKTIAWIGVDSWIELDVRPQVYVRLSNSMPWSVPVPLPKLVLRAAVALESSNLLDINWTTGIEEAECMR